MNSSGLIHILLVVDMWYVIMKTFSTISTAILITTWISFCLQLPSFTLSWFRIKTEPSLQLAVIQPEKKTHHAAFYIPCTIFYNKNITYHDTPNSMTTSSTYIKFAGRYYFPIEYIDPSGFSCIVLAVLRFSRWAIT